MQNVIYIALFGALGAISRYGLNQLVTRFTGDTFPFGILLINLLGCFALGLFTQVSLSSNFITENARNAVAIGFLGAFTTFSTFSHDTFRQIESGRWFDALWNTSGHFILGLLAVFLGVTLARWAVH